MGDEAGHSSPMISAIGEGGPWAAANISAMTTRISTSKPKAWLFCTSRTIPKTHQWFVILWFLLIFFFHFSPHFTSFLFYYLHSFSLFFLLPLIFPLYFTLVPFIFCFWFIVFYSLFIYLFSKYIFRHFNILHYLSSTIIPNIICQ